MEAAVDVDDLPGRHRSPVREENTDHPGHRVGIGRIPPQGSPAAPHPVEVVEAGNRLGRHRPQRAGRHRVDPDAGGPQVTGQVTGDALQGGLGHPHPVIARPGLPIVEVQRHQGPAPRRLQQRPQRHRQRLVREGGSQEGGLGRLGRGVEEVAPEGVLGGVGDGVQGSVHPPPPLLQVGRNGVDVGGVVDVELEDVGGRRQSPGSSLRQPHAPAESGADDVGAFLLGHPGHVPGDGVVGQDPGDEQLLVLEQHCISFLIGRHLLRNRSRRWRWCAAPGP